MSHIAKVGRRSPRVRAGIAALYLLVILGAATTIYPFLLMVSTAMKGQIDYAEYTPAALVPRYLRDTTALYARYVDDRYAGDLDAIDAAHGVAYNTPAAITPPPEADAPGARALTADWNRFTATLDPDLNTSVGFGEQPDSGPSKMLLLYRDHLRAVFDGDLTALNREWTEENVSFAGVAPPFEKTAIREWTTDPGPKGRDWSAFKRSLPPDYRVVSLVDPSYQAFLRENVYNGSLPTLNAAWKTQYTDWNQITLAPTASSVPEGAPYSARVQDWVAFMRTKFPLRLLGLDPAGSALPAWRRFLAAHGPADAAARSDLPRSVPEGGAARTEWMDFIAHDVPLDALAARSPENRWRATLAAEYGSPARANVAFGTAWRTWSDARPPQRLADWYYVQSHAGELRFEFATRNFRYVFDYVALHGRAALNTVLYCSLSVLGALIVNPLCAFALSRFPLAYAYRVLLFLLATMAFPAEVAMIPNFLLLRDLHLLNTFSALVLPGLASGFSIFLLKGFFDSLPRELYEAGILDGGSELTMFARITVPLSLPIFAVIALNAFTAAYGAFLFALVVCQDQSMWTLMVWLYDLQSTAPQYVIMAALTLAALPTLVVFLLAQKVILRGVILPSFK